ncbi:MAG: CehA/McbA family metallohydrolase [Phycisphaeraceae bacterium]|nr:MAG: CehA/McbA family metallohydrolase [Phycisphaeraceae bacterium]
MSLKMRCVSNAREARGSSTTHALLGLLLAGAFALPTLAQPLKVYFGNLHAHTSYSDGSGTPAMAFDHARLNGLDFMAITEHNHAQAERNAGDRRDGILIATDHSLYRGTPANGERSLVDAALEASASGLFVALYGQEFSTISSGNHANVYEVQDVIPSTSGRYDQLVHWLASNPDSTGKPAFIQLNHPSSEYRRTTEYGRDDFGGDDNWIREMGRHAALIEIISGPALSTGSRLSVPRDKEFDYVHYLNLGFRVAPTANQDNHYFNWGDLTTARTGVIAHELSRNAIIEAIRARHVYATTDHNLRVIARVNGRLCGSAIPVPPTGSELAITIEIHDDDEPDAEYRIEVFSDDAPGGPLASSIEFMDLGVGNGTHTVEGIAATGPDQYVFFRIYQRITESDGEDARGDSVWTAPVWMDPRVTDDQAPAPTPSVVASKNSKIYHVDPSCSGARAIKPANKLFGDDAMQGRTPHDGCPR